MIIPDEPFFQVTFFLQSRKIGKKEKTDCVLTKLLFRSILTPIFSERSFSHGAEPDQCVHYRDDRSDYQLRLLFRVPLSDVQRKVDPGEKPGIRRSLISRRISDRFLFSGTLCPKPAKGGKSHGPARLQGRGGKL